MAHFDAAAVAGRQKKLNHKLMNGRFADAQKVSKTVVISGKVKKEKDSITNGCHKIT